MLDSQSAGLSGKRRAPANGQHHSLQVCLWLPFDWGAAFLTVFWHPRVSQAVCRGVLSLLLAPWRETCDNARRLTTTESKNVRFAITTSVLVHVLLLLILGWFMGLSTSARLLLKQQLAVKEEPKVTMIFPEQFIPTPKLRPKLNTKQYIRTTQNDPAPAKPGKSDFISDRNTKAAAEAAPFPDGDKPMPSSRGESRPTLELVNRNFHEGKVASDAAGKPATATPAMAAPTEPRVNPLQPEEPKTVPQVKPTPKAVEVAKADAPTVAKMIEDMDKDSGRMDVTKLPLQVKKADTSPPAPPEPSKPATQPPEAPASVPSKRVMEDFSPITRKASVKGTISNKGEASVDAEATPMGQFMRVVTGAVEKKWHEFRLKHAGTVSNGFLRIKFYVNRAGHVEQPEFLEKSGNPLMDDFTLDAILAADLPPIPKDLLPLLEEDRVPVEYSIIID